MPKISIVIPVYNCKEYLERCVTSVLNQTERDLQVILVNDGSTDGSGALCDEFGAKDDRIVVIHQKNAGVSAARNAGLAAATGEFIGFVDADDYIAPETYERALSECGDCDIVMWDTVTVWDNGKTEADTIPLLPESCVLTCSDWTPELLSQMAGSACRCLYTAARIQDILFPVGIKLSEDRLFNLCAMGKAERLRYLKQGLYFRYVRADSAVHRYHGDKFEKSLLAMKFAKEAIMKYWDTSYLAVYTEMFIIDGALQAIYEICSASFPGKSRIAAIRDITAHSALEEAFALCIPHGLRKKCLKSKMNVGLLLLGIAFNIKNRR